MSESEALVIFRKGLPIEAVRSDSEPAWAVGEADLLAMGVPAAAERVLVSSVTFFPSSFASGVALGVPVRRLAVWVVMAGKCWSLELGGGGAARRTPLQPKAALAVGSKLG